MSILTAMGLMSGTSMDGIDLAVIRTDGEKQLERGPSHFFGYDSQFRKRLESALLAARSIVKRDDRPNEIKDLELELTLRHAEAIRVFRNNLPDKFKQLDLIGFHGQTILHRPERVLTVQIGDGELLARETGVPVIFDLRADDMIHGGQGAPLVPVYHKALAGTLSSDFSDFPVVFVNIGGISNVTYVARHGEILAFDTGPGNMLIDQWVDREGGVPFDQAGMIASEGRADQAIVDKYLQAEFFALPAPKSLDRGDFNLDPVSGMELADGARTLAAFSAHAIFRACLLMPETPKLWIVCGGGRLNPHIISDLAALAETERGAVITAEQAGFDGDSMEAEAWAYLAVRSHMALPITFPSTTGCRKASTGGRLALPDKIGGA